MKYAYRQFALIFAATLLLAVAASAATITGTVTNATTGKPGAGDTVDLLEMQQGMNVLASTKTDAKGSFSFKINDPNSPHLVRVTHDGVGYFPAAGPIRPGSNSTTVDVYDSGSKVSDIGTNVEVMRVQGDGSNLQVIQLIAVKNGSNPPRTLSGKKTYEFYLPEAAQIDQAMVQPPGGMGINTSATPEGSGKYSFDYAIKPGETRFEVAYHLPYSGSAKFAPKTPSDVQHFVVMLPKSMTFQPSAGAPFQLMNDPTATVQIATNVKAGTDLSFQVSGTGALQDDQGGNQQQGQAAPDQGSPSAGMSPDNRPGGGLGPPTDAPDPLHAYRWPILGGLAIILVCGTLFVINSSNQQARAASPAALSDRVGAPVPKKDKAAALAPTEKNSMLLEGLKQELFDLELEKQQGSISESDYQQAKAALDQTLKRALSRKP
jgi:hypothetical protein